MRRETSCGVVVVRETDGARKYLLIQARNGLFGFPKGHMEPGETEIETAVRELREETGVEAEFLPGFRCETEYRVPGNQEIRKKVIFFLGVWRKNEIVCQQAEVLSAGFYTPAEAETMLPFESTRDVLREAERFLNACSRGWNEDVP